MVFGHTIVAELYRHHGHGWIITSINDGYHSHTSFHYSGNAIDYRTKHIPRDKVEDLAKDIKEALGVDFDVILESLNETNEHLHVEYQPRRR